MSDAGRNLGEASLGSRSWGEGLRGRRPENGFAGAGMPISDFGIAIEQFT